MEIRIKTDSDDIDIKSIKPGYLRFKVKGETEFEFKAEKGFREFLSKLVFFLKRLK